MREIKIKQNHGKLVLKFISNSMHVFAFQGKLLDTDANTTLEQFYASIGNKKDFTKELNTPINLLDDTYLRILFTITAPIIDSDYELQLMLFTDENQLYTDDPIVLLGKTTHGEATDFIHIHFTLSDE